MPKASQREIYNGEISAGSLLVSESRVVAEFLLKNLDEPAWEQAILTNNVLQKRNPTSARRQARLIRNRLALMPPEMLHLIAHSGMDDRVQATLAAAIKHSRLLGDFMAKIVGQHWRTFQQKLNRKDWTDFLENCAQVDARVLNWTPNTRSKLKQVTFRILAEAGYVDSTRSLQLLPVRIVPKVRHCLEKHNETYVLNCMDATNQ